MKKLIVLLICAAFCLCGCGSDEAFGLESADMSSAKDDSVEGAEEAPSDPGSEKDEPPVPENIFIYICGAVKRPGVYELPFGSRVYQAVEAAGGLESEADTRTLNQAQLLTDGEQITVLTEEEAGEYGSDGNGTAAASDDGLVNINSAGVSELMTLPGIGQAKAEAIVAYREASGAFGKIEDICNVTGIKDKLYTRISSLITV